MKNIYECFSLLFQIHPIIDKWINSLIWLIYIYIYIFHFQDDFNLTTYYFMFIVFKFGIKINALRSNYYHSSLPLSSSLFILLFIL